MRKILSIVLVALMVSMMIPAMVLAEDAATPEINYAGLVAGETFTVSVPAAGATSVTVSVNSQLFSIEGVEAVDSVASKAAVIADGVATLDVTVNAEIPAVVASSAIKIDVDGTVSYQYAAIADRIIGDVDGDTIVTAGDAGYALAASVGNDVAAAGFKAHLCNVDGDTIITAGDAGYILAGSVGNEIEAIPGMAKAYYGGNAAIEVVDPFAGSDEPAEPVAIATPANIYAYAQNGTIYYAFDAVENATGYDIYVGETVVASVTDVTGSFTYAYTEGLEITVVATTTVEGYTNSAASEAVAVIEADASGALAAWLAENGLEDVAITVHEIK